MDRMRGAGVARACFILIVAASSVSCALLRSTVGAAMGIFEDPRSQAAAGGPMSYRRGVRQLEQEDYKGAITAFEEGLQAEPTSPYTQVAVYNTGRALEGLGRWAEAEQKYRDVVRATARAPKLQALALYRLSFCYEARNDDTRTVAALMDARTRVHHLPEEIAIAEMPARLAAAYARVGNIDEAMKYYAQGEVGISRLRNQAYGGEGGGRAVPEWLPRTLYHMGRMSLRTIAWGDFEDTLRPIERTQLYLLQAAELEAGAYSREAARELIRVYAEIWNVVSTPPPADPADDPVTAKRATQDRQWSFVEKALELSRALKAARAPAEKDRSAQVEEIFAFVANQEKKLLRLLDQPLEGSGLTPEAKARRERIRGRVVEPDDALEKAYEKKAGKRGPQPSVPAASGGGDPNL